MRIAFLVGSLAAGGLERFVTAVSIEAKRQNVFEPVVVCLTRKSGVFLKKLEDQQIVVVEAPSNWYRSIAGILALAKIFKTLSVDVVHSQVNYSMVQQFLAARLARTKFAITERSAYVRRGWSLVRRRIQFAVLKYFNVSYSVNAAPVAHHLATMFREKVTSFTVIPNGVQETNFSPDYILRRRKELNIDEKHLVIGYVARMDPPKGHALFLDVLEELMVKRHHRLTVVFVGDGTLRPMIEERLVEMKLTPFAIFAGVVPDVESWMPVFDMVALLSNREGMPNVVIEAMAAGKPVVGTRVGNMPELLDDDCGVIVDVGNVSAIADAFENLIKDGTTRRRMGDFARQKVNREFSLQATVSKLVNYYRHVLRIEL